MLKDVRLDKSPLFLALDGKEVATACIHEHQPHVLWGVEDTVTHDELVVVGIQVRAKRGIFFLLFGFVGIQLFVGVADVDIGLRLFFLQPLQVERREDCTVGREVFEHADLIAIVQGILLHKCTLLVMGLQLLCQHTGHEHFFF